MRRLYIAHLIVILAFAASAFAQKSTGGSYQVATLTGSDSTADSQFGNPSAISGDTVVVGDIGAGAVYVFVKSADGWQNSTQVAKLTPSISNTGDFGGSVAISGNTIVVGASFANSDQGVVFVYVEPAGGWADMTETAQLAGTSSFGLGLSVAISGNTIVAGSAYAGYVYEKPSSGWVDMTEVAQLSNPAAYGSGSPVAVSGNTIIVVAGGCCNEGQNYPGEADVFVKPSTGWVTKNIPNAALMGSDETADDFYGSALSMSGDTVVVGAYYHHNQVGAAYVFVKPTQGWKSMTQTAELTRPLGQPNDEFGSAVSIAGNTIAVAAYNHFTTPGGAIYTYVKPASGWHTTSQATSELLPPAGQGDSLGYTVGVSGGAVMAGNPFATINSQQNQGAVLIFSH
ncbi:MAG TPA: hypothetical protein VGM18_18200 [Candidatus Sulfotelmatobacter sp.]